MSRAHDTIATILERLRAADGPAREEAADSLLKNVRKALPFLVRMLDEDDASLHDTVAWIISRAGARAVPALEDALSAGSERVRAGSAELLGILHATRSTAPLLRVLADPDAEVRQNAAWALTRVGPSAAAPLVRLLEHPGRLVREQAAWCLAGIGKPSVAPLVRALPGLGEDARTEALSVLGRIGEDAYPALYRLLKSPLADIRRGAMLALKDLDAGACMPRFFPLLLDRDHRVRAAAEAYFAHAGRQGAEFLFGRLEKSDDETGDSLYGVLARSGAASLDLFTGWLSHPDAMIRRRIARILGLIKDPGAVDHLCMVVSKDPDLRVRDTAAWALGSIGDERAVPGLLSTAADPTMDRHRWQAAAVLKNFPARLYADSIIGLLGARHPHVRWRAALALGQSGDPRAAAALLSALAAEKDEEVYMRIIGSLGDTGDAAARPALLNLYANDHVHWQTLRDALGRLRTEAPREY